MNKLKRTLALTLVLCMLCSLLPVSARASENAADTAAGLESTEAVIQATSALTPDEPNRPADNSTTNQPFPSGTGGSTYFRIPALTTLSDGTLVAAADARWTQYMDMGNIDTIVSVSEDKGANWNYTFANYIDDGGNTYNISAATFIDPAIAVKTVDGVETIYMMVDLFPGQKSGDTMCINAALYGTGMSKDGHLLVSDVDDSTLSEFHYYVGDYTDGVAPLCNSDGTATDYTVDEWFNVYKGSTHLGNLFTYGDVFDSETQKTFYVYQTCYLVLTKSTDGGKTWSAPTMLNHQVKNSSEKFYGVGPASGFVTSTGRIMFTAYTYASADGNSSVFYSDDNGVTWTRAASVADQTSEAALTEANGTIYMFTRHGNYYYYSTDNGTTWSGAQTASGISYLPTCEVSVMTYSEKIDGKTAILLSAPTSGNRYGGKIFVGLVNDDHSITWKYTYSVNTTSDRYQYSSLKELNDGSLGLLYENGDASIVYENIAIADIIGEDAVLGTPEEIINMTVGESKEFTLDEVVDSGSHTSDAADITWTKVDTTVSVPAAKLGTTTAFSGSTIDLNDCLYTFTKNSDGTWLLSADVNGTTVYIDAHAGASNGGYPNRTYTTNITLYNGSNGGIKIYDGAGYLHFYDTDGSKLYWDQCTSDNCSGHNLKIYKVADPASTTVLGGYYEQVTDIANLEDGGKYLIVGYNSSTALAGYYAMHPSVSTGDKYSHLAKITGDFTDITTSETTVQIEAKAVGNTSVQIGSMIYNVNVTAVVENTVDIELTAGTTKKVTLPENVGSGSHTSDAADVTWGAEETTVITPNAQLGTNISYSGNTIDLNDCLYTFTKNSDGTWLISAEANGTKVYVDPYVSSNGGYPNRTYTTNVTLTDGNNGAVVFGDGTGYLHFWDNNSSKLYWDNCTGSTCTGHHLLIYKVADTSSTTVLGGYFKQVSLDELVSGEQYLIVGHTTSGYDSNGYYAMHPSTSTSDKWSHLAKITGEVTTTTTSQNVMTINAKAEGTTSVVIGTTQYNISVLPAGGVVVDNEVNVDLTVGQTKTYDDTTGAYTSASTTPDANIVKMELNPVAGNTETTVSTEKVTELEAGATYIIRVYNTEYALSTAAGRGDWGTTTRKFEQNTLTANEAHMWTLEAADGGYKLKSNAGYLSLGTGNNAATLGTDGEVFTFTSTSTGWTIGNQSGRYINALGGLTSYYSAGGWTGDGTRFDLYKVTTSTSASTEITFTGVSVGTTTAIVGTTQYNITVTIPEQTLTLTTGGHSTIVPVAAVTQADIDAFNAANGAYVTAALNADGSVTLTGVAAGTVTNYVLGGTKYTINVVGTPDCVTSENSPFVVGGNFIGSVTNDANNAGLDYLTKLTMSSVMTKQNLGGGSGVGYQIDLNSKFANAENISWSIADESIAKIEVSEDGTSVYVTAADANTPGTTYLSCTIDGQTYTIPVVIMKTTDVTSSGSWKYTSLHIAEITRTDVWYSWNCSGDTDQFVQAIEGEAIWTVFNQADKYCINFYAAPDARHALTFMSATNSDGEYHTLADKENPKNCDFYTIEGAGYDERTSVGFTDDQVAADIQAALDLGCDGAQGFSRGANVNGAVNCNLTFISDPMPELAKTVNGILPITRVQKDFRRYYDGMVATVGEYVYFELTVTLGRPDVWKDEANGIGAIEYSAADLIDTALEGAYFYTKDDDRADEDNPGVLDGVISTESKQVQEQDITDALNATWAADETVRTLSYYVIYEIQPEDIPKFLIENTATLEWDYQSHYSTGALDADAAAEATITVVGRAMDNVVIDFGQKVVYTGLTYSHLKYVNLGTFNSNYGTYIVEGEGEAQDDGIGNTYYNNYKITYTPTAILQSPDAIQLMGTYIDEETGSEVTKVINGFVVYPATTIYYEEGFVLEDNISWPETHSAKATTEQTFELLGLSQYNDNGLFTGFVSDQKHNYGYDPIYDGVEDNGEVADSNISSNTVGQATAFTFTGTGFELFADCTQDSGYVHVMVNNAAGKSVKMFMVDTSVKGGDTGATSGQSGDMDGLPIVSLKDLEHGTYTVTLRKVMNDGKTVTIDGVRIINTYANSIVYTIDNEENPTFYQLRDYVISAIGINAESSEDYGDLTGKAQQVYNDLISKPNIDSNAPTAVITDTNTLYGDSSTLQDLLDNGPKNEIYLWEGQTLTFKLYTARLMQVGLKAPSGETNYTITITPESGNVITNEGSIASTVDMFYTLNNDLAAPQEYLVSITNEGNDTTDKNEVLSITDLKLAYDPSATVQPLTLKDITTVLRAAGYYTSSVPETPEKPAVPFADVAADSFYYDAVAWAVREGITTGISESHFGPMVFCNRAQAVTFLWRAAGSPEPTATEHPFVDVPAGSFYEKAVLWALEKGITTGTDGTHFSPMMSCNRATVVTFLYRAFQSPAVGASENPFSDVPADSWFTAPILWAVEQGITTGMGDGTFDVNGACNRAQIVTFLYRAYN